MITQSRLRELLEYDAALGRFVWRVSQGTRACGSLAGNHRPDGYIYIKLDKRLYRATRLIWLYLYGRWPVVHIDHINGNTSDDRLVNLREATRHQNLGNRQINKNNKTGFKGVSMRGLRFVAKIRNVNLGYYNTAEEAHAVYMAKAKELYGEFARAR